MAKHRTPESSTFAEHEKSEARLKKQWGTAKEAQKDTIRKILSSGSSKENVNSALRAAKAVRMLEEEISSVYKIMDEMTDPEKTASKPLHPR